MLRLKTPNFYNFQFIYMNYPIMQHAPHYIYDNRIKTGRHPLYFCKNIFKLKWKPLGSLFKSRCSHINQNVGSMMNEIVFLA